MIFPLLEYGLKRGQRVAVATPRKDVVLELAPRIQKAFPDYSLVTLYGGSSERWEQGDITLATTHQLLRFRHSFHLVVIDELDAFPYHNNPMLQYAAREVIVPGGKTLFLSATPPQHMQRDARWGRLPHVKVPVRYHRHPLPIPRLLRIRPLPYYLDKQQLPVGLFKALSASLDRGAQLFLFISKIKWVQPFVAILQKAFPETAIAGTASTDPERAEKVIAFRQKKITMLVTTTILERGVTVPKTDVFILNADAALFDEASLVQMAGRAGRSKDDPAGRVYFIASDVTRSQKGAIRQMKAMNRIAERQGYLLSRKEHEPVKS
ncbi:helicase-related protein [Paenibacillus senegalensis]|uniref:helicase-related protein n=1 Tax=Paenibacillus senegalensis TaxID=1465766 RepID=UPI0002881CEE|nr:helicase-related protein [Paenibacillus senegalensis]